jgi:thioredoxin 1
MGKDLDQPQFEAALKADKKLVILFYASWCPFSRAFLPIYERCTVDNPTPCMRVMVDENEELCDKYDIEIYPTVLVFEDGEVVQRLESGPHVGLNEKQLKKLLGLK